MPASKPAKAPSGRTDWAALRTRTEDEIERLAMQDTDNPASDESHWAEATIGLPPIKTAVHASFDHDVVAFFKRGGKGYQARMNAVLRRYMEDQQSGRKSD